MSFEWINLFQFTFVVFAFVLAGLTLSQERTRTLALFFMVIGLHGAFSRLPFAKDTVLDTYSYALAFAYGPLVYLALRNLLRVVKLGRADVLLVVVPVLAAALMLAAGYGDTALPGILLTLAQLCAVYAGFRELKSYGSVIEQSSAEPITSAIGWVRSALWLYLAIVVLLALRFLVSTAAPETLISVLDLSVALGIAAILAATTIKVVLAPDWIPQVTEPEQKLAKELDKHRTPTEEQVRLAGELDDYLVAEQTYLDPGLNVGTLAQQIGWPPRQLSEVINSVDQLTFSQKINRLRVQEAQRLLTSQGSKGYSLLDIALQSGFNSKSAFNLMFKRFAGETPSQYRKKLQKNTS